MQEEHASPEPVETTEESSLVVADANEVIETTIATPTDDGREVVAAAEQTVEIGEAKRALEAVLLAANEPMPLSELKRVFDGELAVETIRHLLEELRLEWAGRSAELVTVASGYRFRVKPEHQKYLDRLTNDRPPKYSRAVLETLAIIAYRQPVTRGDIEDIRGVAVSPHILKTLEDRGWIEEIGHRETPGRPVLFGTTAHFLDDLNLRTLEELPPLHELQSTLDMSQPSNSLALDAAVTLTPMLPGVMASDEAIGIAAATDIDEAVPRDDAATPVVDAHGGDVPATSSDEAAAFETTDLTADVSQPDRNEVVDKESSHHG